MHKYIAIALKVILFAYFAFILTKYTLYKQALIKQKTETFLTTSTRNATLEETQVLERLHQLASLPLVGSYFVHPMAEELIRLSRYHDSLKVIEDSLSSQFKRKDYNLWLSKAKAHLFLQQIEECEQSLVMASLYSKNRKQQRKITIIFEVLSNWKASKMVGITQEVPLQVRQVYDNESDYMKMLQQRENQIL